MKLAVVSHCVMFSLVLAGCSVSSESKSSFDRDVIECRSDADCDEGSCALGSCVAVRSALARVALEIIAPASVSAGEYQQMRFLQTIELGSPGAYDIQLDYVADLAVAMKSPSDACVYGNTDAEGRLPIRVEALQDPRVTGIGSSSYLGASDVADGDNGARLRVPPGLVDLYVEPVVDPADAAEAPSDCSLVPFLALGQKIEAGNVVVEQRFSVAQHLSVDVTLPVNAEGNSPLEGFTVDVVEPLHGRRLSTQAILGAPSIVDGVAHHVIELVYQPVVGTGASELSGLELFRFTPKADVISPSFYVARLAADLFGTNQLVINHIVKVPETVVVEGQVETEATHVPVASQVTAVLRSASDPTTGALTQYRVTSASDKEGRFRLTLVAGEYDVVATPLAGLQYASGVASWLVASGPDNPSGKLLSLPEMSLIAGRVSGSSSDNSHWSASVIAVPSTIGAKSTFIESLVGQQGYGLGRRAASGSVESDGAFELAVDPGTYDVCIRPAEGSGYPWAVRPNTDVTLGDVGLGPIRLSAPFSFNGSVTVPGTSIDGSSVVLPGALIRAFALFDSNGRLVGDLAAASGAVQIGEARASAKGQYELLLPASLE